MPAANPRIHVVLEKPLFDAVERMAEREGVSLSLKVRDLVREAIELYEDLTLGDVAKAREKTFKRSKALSHSAVFGHLKKKKAA